MAYRAPAKLDRPSVPRFAKRRPLPRVIFGALLICTLLGIAFGLFLQVSGSSTGYLVSVFVFAMLGIPALAMFLCRQKTAVYEDRVEQGYFFPTRVAFDDVRHVIRVQSVLDPFVAITRATAAGFDTLKLMTDRRTSVTLLAGDVPDELRSEIATSSLETAVRAAAGTIAAGGAYDDPDRLSGISATTLHGFKVGLRITKTSAPLSEVVSVDRRSGLVVTSTDEKFSVAKFDEVLHALIERHSRSHP